MPEPVETTGSDELIARSMLYLAGDLAADEAGEFEARAAGDPACQRAMIHAVRLWSGLGQLIEPQPEPGYRQRVAERLRGRRLVQPIARRAWWPPLAGGLVGALAATIFVLLLNPWQWFALPAGEALVNAPPVQPIESKAEVIYSDLTNTDRLARIRGEQELRRQKDEDLRNSHPILEHLRKPRPTPSQRMM
jgi:anti-sigma factor RsiW